MLPSRDRQEAGFRRAFLPAEVGRCTSASHDLKVLADTGVALSRAGRYADAADCYRKALAIKPGIPELRMNLALAEFKLGHFRAAIPMFRDIAAKQPQNEQAHTLLGMSYYGAGMYADAARALEPVLADSPANAELRYIVAQSYLWAADYSHALTEFEQLARDQPDSAGVHILLAQAQDGLGHADEALQELEAAARISPSEPNVHFGIGYLLWKGNRLEEAERSFRIELAHDANHAKACAWLGDIALQQQEYAKAKPLLEKAVRLDPKIRIAHLDLGGVHENEGNYSKAVLEYQAAIRLDPSRTDARYRLARVYQRMSRPEDARKELAALKQLVEKQGQDSLASVSGRGDAPAR
jgi:tetratricopeptide (TPR) repeat protein